MMDMLRILDPDIGRSAQYLSRNAPSSPAMRGEMAKRPWPETTASALGKEVRTKVKERLGGLHEEVAPADKTGVA
jgi:hypothetical protein